ncbi:acyl-CoA thioesterase [Alicyclobacillus cycloheptanicus]|jgi:acyl-CoA hydrolase|uniref:Acyl-CoA hydrolase n=1 Tax=Alicyclobacillus cycloheptanicus TaxID=1457 RepID=A0ABT9XF75_9BACL|nr:acyl-CoA thioesterase [Alicyclobacillus cycloheptanicus]MDQ0188950.1 acyl-CoA hydrolase [Alicyclobacillus cycloheptanicus]WDM01701.1 acyl-CoA thioesterase [Alicyclobacillus cycloheptanicus]
MEGKPARLSRTTLTDHVLPPDTNYHNTIFGGKVMAYIDKVSAMAAMRHCRMPVVTASMDSMDFLAPIKLGQAIYVEAFVTWTHHTSMEVFVSVEAEDLLTGERQLTGTSYLTFVALDENGKPCPVPPVMPETEEEKWHHDTAEARYLARKARKSTLESKRG